MKDECLERLGFGPADIMVPQNCDLSKWSVVACDQYTSQPEYWQRVEEHVARAPSALRLILPESKLEGDRVDENIAEINLTMTEYLREERFQTYPDSLIYVERRLADGCVRRGLVGMVDLEQYDYEPGASTMIRATEGTVLSRIPPRVKVRKNAPIELPHVMLLTDDPEKTVIEPLAQGKEYLKQVYDFELMENGGHISGWLLGAQETEQVARALSALAAPETFAERYHAPERPVLLFAVGDGNHSLATAKACYEKQKDLIGEEKAAQHPARYALVELVNLHDESLQFEPIHRVVFGTEPEVLLEELVKAYPGSHLGEGDGHVIRFVFGDEEGTVTLPRTSAQLAVGALQNFLDKWLKGKDCKVDYIHGDEVVRELSAASGCIGFLLPAMEKEQLFPTVIFDGVLPRKTFSMGHAHDKRFYLEARRIR